MTCYVMGVKLNLEFIIAQNPDTLFAMEIALCLYSLYMLARAAPLQPVCCMLVAAIYSAGGNTENMKCCQVSLFCWLPAGPGVFNSTCCTRLVKGFRLVSFESYSFLKSKRAIYAFLNLNWFDPK